ncbi:MAG TPA: YgiQ family radical SAM protein [Bacillota bacterium]|nr:YgiQ family radical SAM protein [Bacillota bacterium]
MEMNLAARPLPMSRAEMEAADIEVLDFLLITGDAYVDHPSFGAALIGRILAAAGYRVGILAQPDWRKPEDLLIMGRPRLGVLVTAGNVDSMVANYTAAGKPRREDDYSPGRSGGRRPDRATIVYGQMARRVFGDIPIVLGGVEASLRKLAHYDYWSDSVRRSVLVDSRADAILFGMADISVLDLASSLASGNRDFSGLRGAVYVASQCPGDAVVLPSYEETAMSKKSYGQAFRLSYAERDAITGRKLCQAHGDKYVVVNRPPQPLNTEQLDWIYSLPFTRTCHPVYAGGIKALEEVEFSITSHRGCYGNCSFCALTSHQGRVIQRRSFDSILSEARLLTTLPGFKGFIHDIGGPTANFHTPACDRQTDKGACRGRECISQEACRELSVSHDEYLNVLRAVRNLPGVKKAFIRSGIRYDYVMLDPDSTFFNELCEHHISGQLKVAPEHVSSRVLKVMGKPGRQVYEAFLAKYSAINESLGKEQYVVPYFMSSHPGSTIEDAIELAEYLRDKHIRPRQVQDFIPTPGSLSTCIYHTGEHPLTGEKIFVPRTAADKNAQRALLQYFLPKNHHLVRTTLLAAGRGDLVGYGARCLVPPARPVGSALSPGGKKPAKKTRRSGWKGKKEQ